MQRAVDRGHRDAATAATEAPAAAQADDQDLLGNAAVAERLRGAPPDDPDGDLLGRMGAGDEAGVGDMHGHGSHGAPAGAPAAAAATPGATPGAAPAGAPGQGLTVTHTTALQAPGGRPDRDTVGVGEVVNFTGGSPGAWTATGGTAGGQGPTFSWTAPDVEGTYRVTLTAGTETKTVEIKVLKPSHILFTHPAADGWEADLAGAGMEIGVEFRAAGDVPVSFGNVDMAEKPGTGAGLEGFFQPHSQDFNHYPAGAHRIGEDNVLSVPDHAASRPYEGPFRQGSFYWDIPNVYQVNGGAEHPIVHTRQTFLIGDDGAFTVRKEEPGYGAPAETSRPGPANPTMSQHPGAQLTGDQGPWDDTFSYDSVEAAQRQPALILLRQYTNMRTSDPAGAARILQALQLNNPEFRVDLHVIDPDSWGSQGDLTLEGHRPQRVELTNAANQSLPFRFAQLFGSGPLPDHIEVMGYAGQETMFWSWALPFEASSGNRLEPAPVTSTQFRVDVHVAG